MIRSIKYLTAAACIMVLVPSFASARLISGADLAGVGQKPDPGAAAKLSLSEARDIIQRGYRYWGSDGASDHASTTMEFNPKQMVATGYNSDGTKNIWPGCPYETYAPYVDSQLTTYTTGIHKGSPLYDAKSECDIPGNYWVEVRLPTPEAAYRVTVALLRWKMSSLAERQALPALEEQQFAPIASAYRSSNPRPQVGEDVRRFQIAAETAVGEKRFSDAVNAYEDGLKLAPWWPEGHFNIALALGELHYYDEAIAHMTRYLQLVPEASDARAAQDKIYAWQSEQPALPPGFTAQPNTAAPPSRGKPF